jgi:hypothetical protein
MKGTQSDTGVTERGAHHRDGDLPRRMLLEFESLVLSVRIALVNV